MKIIYIININNLEIYEENIEAEIYGYNEVLQEIFLN